MKTPQNYPYKDAVFTARRLHAVRNFMTVSDKPWMVEPAGNLVRLTVKALQKRHNDGGYIVTSVYWYSG